MSFKIKDMEIVNDSGDFQVRGSISDKAYHAGNPPPEDINSNWTNMPLWYHTDIGKRFRWTHLSSETLLLGWHDGGTGLANNSWYYGTDFGRAIVVTKVYAISSGGGHAYMDGDYAGTTKTSFSRFIFNNTDKQASVRRTDRSLALALVKGYEQPNLGSKKQRYYAF